MGAGTAEEEVTVSTPSATEGHLLSSWRAGQAFSSLLRTSRICPPRLAYAQVAAGERHAVFRRSDGTAVATGDNRFGQCDIPAAPVGQKYTHVAAGFCFTVLLTSEGGAVARGMSDSFGAGAAPMDAQMATQIPPLGAGQTCVADRFPGLDLQAVYSGGAMRFLTLSGAERWSTRAAPSARLADIYAQLAAGCRAGLLGPRIRRADATLPTGQLLGGASATETIAAARGLRPRRLRGKRPREERWGA